MFFDGFGATGLLFVMLIVGIFAFFGILRLVFGINLLDRTKSRNRLVLGLVTAAALLAGMRHLTSGKLVTIGRKHARPDQEQIARLNRMEQRFQ